MSIKNKMTRKAAKKTVKHSAHGTASKLKREPLRSVTLLAIGCALGVVAGWFVARSNGSEAHASPAA